METFVSHGAEEEFKDADQFIGELDAGDIARVITASSDLAIVMDDDGVILDVAIQAPSLVDTAGGEWVGQLWVDTVSAGSRETVENLLDLARNAEKPVWREVTYPLVRGGAVTVSHCATRMREGGSLLVVGRDMQSTVSLHRRLLDMQQLMEREYARMRQTETRYRLLFEHAAEPVFIVSADNNVIIDVNPAASRLLRFDRERLKGRPFFDLFDPANRQTLYGVFGAVQTGGRHDPVDVFLAEPNEAVSVSVSLFQQGVTPHFLIRVYGQSGSKSALTRIGGEDNKLRFAIDRLPDGFVVTDIDRKIIDVNNSFLDLIQFGSRDEVRGEQLERWFGRPGIDIDILVSNLADHGSVGCFSTIVRGELGAIESVEVSAVSLPHTEPASFGFVIRNVSARSVLDTKPRRGLPRSVEQLTELIGRVPLKEIVRETTDVIEKLCIEAALELTGDNRASAAQMLGLSRQSLYSKLRRYDLGDGNGEDGDADIN